MGKIHESSREAHTACEASKSRPVEPADVDYSTSQREIVSEPVHELLYVQRVHVTPNTVVTVPVHRDDWTALGLICEAGVCLVPKVSRGC